MQQVGQSFLVELARAGKREICVEEVLDLERRSELLDGVRGPHRDGIHRPAHAARAVIVGDEQEADAHPLPRIAGQADGLFGPASGVVGRVVRCQGQPGLPAVGGELYLGGRGNRERRQCR